MGKQGFRDIGGGPYTYWETAGGESSALGLDTTNSNALTLSVSSSSGITPAASPSFVLYNNGCKNLPQQSAFFAYCNATIPNLTGNSNLETVTFNTILFDVDSNFDGTNFTAPITGKYRFILNSTFSNLSSSSSFVGGATHLLTSTGLLYFEGEQVYVQQTAAATCSRNQIGGIMIPMSAGDTCQMLVRVQGTSQTAGILGDPDIPYTFFAGWLDV